MKPGLARTTQGGPSAIFRSHPELCGIFDMCLKYRYVNEGEGHRPDKNNLLEYKRIVPFREPRANVGIHGVNVCLVNSHTFPCQA